MHVEYANALQEEVTSYIATIFADKHIMIEPILGDDNSKTICIVSNDHMMNGAESLELTIAADGVIFDAGISYITSAKSPRKAKCNIDVSFDVDECVDQIKIDDVVIKGWQSLKYSES